MRFACTFVSHERFPSRPRRRATGTRRQSRPEKTLDLLACRSTQPAIQTLARGSSAAPASRPRPAARLVLREQDAGPAREDAAFACGPQHAAARIRVAPVAWCRRDKTCIRQHARSARRARSRFVRKEGAMRARGAMDANGGRVGGAAESPINKALGRIRSPRSRRRTRC